MLNPIILFDGECNLCNAVVQFILKNEDNQSIKFASLQSNFGQNFCAQNNLKPDVFETIIFIEEGKHYVKSAAVFKIIHYLPTYKWLRIFEVFPTSLADYIYMKISKNRKKWFGTPANCFTPSAEILDRFLT